MTQTIKIKRSSSAASPSALENGELAYSSNSNYLYIGRPGGGTGDIDVIGGKAYIDMLEGSSAVPNNLIIENSATVGGHVELREATNNGANYVRLKSPNTLGANLTLTLPATVSDGQFLTTDGSGNLSFAAIPSGSFTISDNQSPANTDTFTTGQTLAFNGGTGITTTISDNAVAIANDGVLDITTSTGLSTNTSATGSVSITNTDRGSSQNIFKTFAVSGQSDVVADSNSDTLTLVQGGATTITTNATSDEITISSTDANVSEANLRTQLGNITENVTIGDATDVTVTTAGNLTVTGDLTVSGTTTTVNSETLTVDDNIIVLNNNVTGAPTENAGIEIERGTSTNVLLRYNETNDRWEFTNNGTNYFNLPTSTEYDAYTSWTVGDGTNTEAVTSGFSLTFDASSFSYTAGTNTVAITTLDGGTYS